MRMQKPLKRFIWLVLATACTNAVAWWKMIPAPLPVYIMITCLGFQLWTLCFLADRLLATRLKGILSTLVFPAAWCGIEYAMSMIPAKGSWTALAYSQGGNLPLLQLASVTGIWGISFLITWFASIVNLAWTQHFNWHYFRREAIFFAMVAGCIYLFGIIRLNFVLPRSETVHTASIVQSRYLNKELATCKWSDAQAIGKYSRDIEQNLLEKTVQAAHAGASIILWQESAGFIPMDEESEFINKAKAIAAHEKIYLLMTLWSVPQNFPQKLIENKLIAIDPAGKEQIIYHKSNPVTVEPIFKGDGLLPVLETPYGRIASAICFDGDFQGFIRQAGRKKAGILFLPANDWKQIDPLHSQMAIMRAIENGFSLVHPAGPGLSVATDNRGRIISSLDYFSGDEQIMYAEVPSASVFTIYSLIGDTFAWLCIAGFALLFFKAMLTPAAEINLQNFAGSRRCAEAPVGNI